MTDVATEASGAGGYLSWKRRAGSGEFGQAKESRGRSRMLASSILVGVVSIDGQSLSAKPGHYLFLGPDSLHIQ